LAVQVCVFLGGAVSMSIIWRDRIVFLESDARSKRIRLRTRWFLLIDFVFYCILNFFVIGAILSGVFAFFR